VILIVIDISTAVQDNGEIHCSAVHIQLHCPHPKPLSQSSYFPWNQAVHICFDISEVWLWLPNYKTSGRRIGGQQARTRSHRWLR